MDDDAWCGLANLTEPELVRAIHEDHIRAGADIIITNTFMSGLGPMQRAGAGESFTEGIDNAVRAARQAVQAVAKRPVAIAGSVGTTPWGAPQAGGAAGLRDAYARQVDLLTEGGVDLIALEIVTDLRLAVAALDAALAIGLPVWLGLSMQIAGRDSGEYDSLPDFDDARAVAEACLTAQLDAVTGRVPARPLSDARRIKV
jgi:5-methyltetrahydrofolate--homocysteine methyltransferase